MSDPQPPAPERDPSCVERWPECESGMYDPRCCRFPKSCSCSVPPAPEASVIELMTPLVAAGVDVNGMPHECCEVWPECSHVYYAVAARGPLAARLREAERHVQAAEETINDQHELIVERMERAEAAEARVRELEEALRAAADLLPVQYQSREILLRALLGSGEGQEQGA